MNGNTRQSRRQRIALLASGMDLAGNLPVVCDIGALPVEPPPYRLLVSEGAARLVAFEPQRDAYDRLCAAAGENETYINKALGKPGPATLNVYRSAGYTSLYRLDPKRVAYLGRSAGLPTPVEQVPLELHALDALDEVPPVDLLKIDVQGAELQIIQSGRTKLRDAVAAIVEVRFLRIYEDEPDWAELDAEMRAQGMVLHKFLPHHGRLLPSRHSGRLRVATAGSQLIDGDAVYIRAMDDPDALSDRQLMCQALFAATVYGSHDLALMCLDLLAARGRVAGDLGERYLELLPEGLLAPGGQTEAAE